MEAYLTSEMIKAIAEGNLFRGIGFAVVFFFIWLEVKGVRKEIKTLNKTLGDSLSDGEKRFDKIEMHLLQFEDKLLKFQGRLTRVETPQTMNVEVKL